MTFRRADAIEDELHYYFKREKHPPSAKYLDPQELGRDRTSAWKGALAGAGAGLIAGIAMLQFQKLARSAASGDADASKDLRTNVPEHRENTSEQSGSPASNDATVLTADRAARVVADRGLSDKEKRVAGPAVHLGFAAAMGAIYGIIAEKRPLVTTGQGTFFGSTLFLAADEIAVPALGLSQPPNKTPLHKHLYGWVSHLVYGFALESLRQVMRKDRR